jgi:GNAT superfamily N-acetyltransferase
MAPHYDSYARYLAGLGTKWSPARVDGLIREFQSGWLAERSWTDSAGHLAWGLLERSSARGVRVHALHFERANAQSLGDWFDVVQRSDDGPVYAVTDLLEGLDQAEQQRIFSGRGLGHRRMIRMELTEDSPRPRLSTIDRFRTFVPEDWPAFASLYRRVYDEPQGDYWLQPAPDVEADASVFFRQFLDPTGAWSPRVVRAGSVVYEADGRMVGNVLLARRDPETCHISGLMVDPEYRGRGVGTALCGRALEAAWETGARRVDLTTLGYSDAHRLYTRLGFRDCTAPADRLPGYWVRLPHDPG